MDPVAALGLAANIVQFVDFSCKLFSQTVEIHKSATGTSGHARELETIVRDIKKLIEGLEISTARGTASAGSLLRSFAFDCKGVADDLLRAIGELRKGSPNTKWGSFRTALQHVLRPEEIQRIAASVSQLQNQVGTQLLALMSAQQHEMIAKLGELEDNDRRLDMAGTVRLQQLKDALLQSVESLRQDCKLQHNSIKAHLEALNTTRDCEPKDVQALSSRMDGLRDALQAFAQETEKVGVEQSVLDSLTYEGSHQRAEQVRTAHSNTFNWIFDERFTACPKSTQTFAQWLRSDDGLCWIAGKPGAGKSTLLKRILSDERTRQELRKWSRRTGHELCIGSYFFWIAGTPLQKSQEGLLRSLLQTVFRQTPATIPLVCGTKRLTASSPYRSVREPWTRSELFETLEAIADRQESTVKYCFFIDGLDEYKVPEEGDYDDLVKLLQHLSACQNFKFCVASREENEFRDQYLNVNHYILQQLTANDIANFVHTLLGESQHFRRLSIEDAAYLELEAEVVRRAQGVFLWVSLVVKTFRDGMRNSDTIADLRRELDNLPDSLETYFKRIILAIEPRYRRASARILQVTNQAVGPLQLLTYYFLDGIPATKQSILGWGALSHAEIDRYHEDARRRLTARSKGLLEVVESSTGPESQAGSHPYFRYSVLYLHRTTRDFLFETSEMQTFFEELLPDSYAAQHEICKAMVGLLDLVPLCPCGCDRKAAPKPGHSPFEAILWSLMIHAQRQWRTCGDPQIAVLREAERIVLQRPGQWRYSKSTAFVGLAVEFGLVGFVKLRIGESPGLLHARSRPLLAYALSYFSPAVPAPVLMDVVDVESDTRLAMADLLLRHGAEVERRIWCPLLRALHERNMQERKDIRGRRNIQEWKNINIADLALGCHKAGLQERHDLLAVFTLLVRHGANLDEPVVIGHEFKMRRHTGRSGDMYRQEVQVDQTQQANEIIGDYFSSADATAIRRHVQANAQRSWFSWLLTPD